MKNIHDEIREKIEETNASYVLITCAKPSASGDMNVELSYGGDPVLAEFLIQGAQNYFEQPENLEREVLI